MKLVSAELTAKSSMGKDADEMGKWVANGDWHQKLSQFQRDGFVWDANNRRDE